MKIACTEMNVFWSVGNQINKDIARQFSHIPTCSIAQLDAPSDWRPGGRGFDPRRGRQHSFVEIDHEIFSTVILSLPLIQEGQLSVSGERMCTILVYRLEDLACPINVWLCKLTALDMTPLGWLCRKTSTQSITKTCLFKYTENFTTKNEKNSDKNSDIFHISAQNIDCGYSLEPPRWGGSNEYPQSMFLSRNKKNNVYPCKPQFYYIKVGFKGV